MASIRGGTEVPVGAGFMSAVTLQGMPTSPVTFTPDDLAQDPYSSSIPFDSNAADSELPSDAVPGTEPGAAPEVAPDASPDSVGIEPESSEPRYVIGPARSCVRTCKPDGACRIRRSTRWTNNHTKF